MYFHPPLFVRQPFSKPEIASFLGLANENLVIFAERDASITRLAPFQDNSEQL